MKIRTKITLWYSLLSAVVLAVMLPLLYSAVSNVMTQTLQAKMQSCISNAVSSMELEDGVVALDEEDFALDSGTYLSVSDSSGAVLYMTPGMQTILEAQASKDGILSAHGNKWRVQNQEYEINEAVYTILAVSSMKYIEDSLCALLLVMLLSAPVFLGLSAFGAFNLAKRALRPAMKSPRRPAPLETAASPTGLRLSRQRMRWENCLTPLMKCWISWSCSFSGSVSSPRMLPTN